MSRTDPIIHCGIQTLSFAQLDHLNGFTKGTTFRLFKAAREQLVEDRDYFHLPYPSNGPFIEALKASGQVYASTVNLVLLSRDGYTRLRRITQGAERDPARRG